MRDHRPEEISCLLGQTQLLSLHQHARSLQKIEQQLQKIIPLQLLPYCRVANFRQGNLLIETASSNHQRILNYERISILSKLRQNGFSQLAGVEFKINPALYHQSKVAEMPAIFETNNKKEKSYLTESAAQSILAAAQMAPPRLKAQLEKLAKHKK